MHLCDRINNGTLFYEHGHTDPADIQKERQLQEERDHCKEVVFEYNNTHPRGCTQTGDHERPFGQLRSALLL